MRGLLHQLGITIRLYLRNRMGLLYGYLFPTIFLVAFWVLYRYENPPLVRHMGELLTVTALGGACFGLPTALVSERERGVWRRYRLAPLPTGMLVASTVAARYLILLSAALLQLLLALAIGMPLPAHPAGLWVAFTFVSFAFLGLGLVIAMLADTVPAVQALGQSIFLPMLIIGGVAVRLESLPAWAQHASAFFPGRYAVEALQACVTGEGLGSAGFSLLALLLIGGAGCVAGARMFRWDAQERALTRRSRGWVAVALAAWVAVGLMAQGRGLIAGARPTALQDSGAASALPSPAPPPARPDTVVSVPGAAASPVVATPDSMADSVALPPTPPTRAETPQAPSASARVGTWQTVTSEQIENTRFDGLPPDAGVVTPVAPVKALADPGLPADVQCIRDMLPQWEPGVVDDPVQRVRNLLFVAAAPDVFQMEAIESLVPLVVFDRLRQITPSDQLAQILYWIASHPADGDLPAVGMLREVCIDASGRTPDVALLRERTAIYAVKLLGRLTGRIVSR